MAESFQQFNDLERSRAVETGCRLVEEEHCRIGKQLNTNGSSLSFTTRDTSDHGVSDLGIFALCQTEFFDEFVDSLSLLTFRKGLESEISAELESFRRSECCEENVVLHDVSDLIGVIIHVGDVIAVKHKTSVDFHIISHQTTGEEVQHSRLAATRRPKDSSEVAWLQSTTQVLQDRSSFSDIRLLSICIGDSPLDKCVNVQISPGDFNRVSDFDSLFRVDFVLNSAISFYFRLLTRLLVLQRIAFSGHVLRGHFDAWLH